MIHTRSVMTDCFMDDGIEFFIREFKIVKETPKKYLVSIIDYDKDQTVYQSSIKYYLKTKVEITKDQTINDFFKKMYSEIEEALSSNDENKKKYIKLKKKLKEKQKDITFFFNKQ